MRFELTLYGRGASRHDLVISGHPAALWSDALAGHVRSDEQLFRGSDIVDLETSLESGIVRSGDVLTVGTPGEDHGWPLDSPCLAVHGGTCAGELMPLRQLVVDVGRAAPADVLIEDATVSGRHARLSLLSDGSIEVVDLGSTNGTVVRGRRLERDGSAIVKAGERFLLGHAMVSVVAPARPTGSVERSPDGLWLFNRVVRYDTAIVPRRIDLPVEPDATSSSPAWPQYVGSGAMLAAGVGSALAFGNPLYAVFGALGPIVLMVTTALVHRRGRATERARVRKAAEERGAALVQAREAADAESELAWERTLDPARAALASIGPTADLWSADAAGQQGLTVRVGTHDRPAVVIMNAAGAPSAGAPGLVAAPVEVDLRATPVLGIAGDPADARGVARAIVHQLAVSRSPDDLWIYHLTAEDDRTSWSWLRWLPHTRMADESSHSVSPSGAALKARTDELVAMIEQRRALSSALGLGQQMMPEILVVMDGAGALRNRSAIVNVLQEGPSLGFAVVSLDRDLARLPAEATARLLVDGPRSRLEVRGGGTFGDVTVDEVSSAVAERSARAIAPLQPLGGKDDNALPRSVRLLDLIDLDLTRPTQVLAAWSSGTETEVALGIDEHGNRCTVDLVRDGPHAVVAGTSGSGKSELLRTLVAGLALSATPADLALLLIDYKGGGAFGKLESLPHVVGYADDLSIGGVLAGRLLESLRAELEYRKTQFKAAGSVEGLPEYRSARVSKPELPSIARLVIVVDEFAELKEAQPDFIDGLVNVARVGRSLGVHLVLATQQPAGVVTPQIRDNANLRICLRVLDPGTSVDLVKTPLAGSFSNRDKGRAIVASGDRPPVVLQTAYVSAARGEEQADSVPPPQSDERPWASCGTTLAPMARAEGRDTGETDLSRLVDVIRDAADSAGQVPSRRPWQPPLPESVRLSTLEAALPEGAPAVFGVEDHPRRQRQTGLSMVLDGGNLGIAGGRGSGRSTALRTLAVAMARRQSADDLHLYVYDLSPAPALRALARLPHCGVVATRSDHYVLARLTSRLSDELAERRALLAGTGSATFADLRRAMADPPPWVLVLVDGWDLLASSDAEELREGLTRLAEDGPALGIQLAVTGGKALATSKLVSTFRDLFVLRFDQLDDMAAFGVPVRQLPQDLPAGRAVRPGRADGIQFALLDGDPSPEAQSDALRGIANAMAAPTRRRPTSFRELPTRISLSEALLTPGATGATGLRVVVAVGGDDVVCQEVDLDSVRPALVITGPHGTGRTTALAVIATQLVSRGVPVVLHNVRANDAQLFPHECLADLAPDAWPEGAVVLVDDGDALATDDLIVTAALEGRAAAACISGDAGGLGGYVGWQNKLRGGCSAGLLLSPRVLEGSLVGRTIDARLAFSGIPGRALLVTSQTVMLTQIPVID